MGAAAHPRAPKRVLRELAVDPDIYVREFVGGNLRTPRRVRLRLLSDPVPLVRMSASWTFDGSTIREQQELVERAKRKGGRLLVFGEWIRIPARWRDVATW
jgi:hypothetical protein